MWHEARKQERKIRGMIVDYRKRAERRQDFYERIKADPAQFIQIHGRKCKIHLDHTVTTAEDGAGIIVPWQGDEQNLIDRFDVRAHLEVISTPSRTEETPLNLDDRQCNYERYRILAQNEFLGISEEKFLYQLRLEEQFGATIHVENEKVAQKKKIATSRAAISFSYEVNEAVEPQTKPANNNPCVEAADSDSDLDMDVTIDVNQLDTFQANELNSCGRNYGMVENDFYSFLTKDADEAIEMKLAKEVEQEKSMLSGRKSRRERRVQREKRLSGKPMSPPSYAAVEDDHKVKCDNNDDSDSQSHSSGSSEKITFITSFGGEDELHSHSKIVVNTKKYQKKSPPVTDKYYKKDARVSTNFTSSRDTHKQYTPAKLQHNKKTALGNNSNSSSRNNKSSPNHDRYTHKGDSPKRIKPRSPPLKVLQSPKATVVQLDESVNRKPENSHAGPSNEMKTSISHTLENLSKRDVHEIPIKRYYGRKRDNNSSSSEESSENDPNHQNGKNETPKESSSLTDKVGKGTHTTSLTVPSLTQLQEVDGRTTQNLRDKLKRKMQALLNRQYKADKKAELEKTERQMQQQQEREDEMRELALKLRKRQRELRHKYGAPNSESSSSSDSKSDNSSESSRTGSYDRKKTNSRSRESRRSTSRSRSRSSRKPPPLHRPRSRQRDRYNSSERDNSTKVHSSSSSSKSYNRKTSRWDNCETRKSYRDSYSSHRYRDNDDRYNEKRTRVTSDYSRRKREER